MGCPHLTYFVELGEEPLLALFEQPGLLEQLRESQAAIALAMLDLSPGRQRVIEALNRAAIPVTAWLLVHEADGYWLTADNVRSAEQRYGELHHWATRLGLELEAIGLDIETPRQDALALLQHGYRALQRLVRERRTRVALRLAVQRYHALIGRMRADGYRVESYQTPVILDERAARSTLLQRVFGLVDVPTDREVLMLYSSILPAPFGEALVDTYGPAAQAIGVGVTGGGVELLGELFTGRHLDYERLLADLRRASRYTDQLYVFSLEGCVAAGFFPQLCLTDLSSPLAPARLTSVCRLARAALRHLLRAEQLWPLL